MRKLIAALALALVVAATAAITAYATSDDGISQDDFPCLEDEVLGYDPSFGPDEVGCIHIEGDVIERP